MKLLVDPKKGIRGNAGHCAVACAIREKVPTVEGLIVSYQYDEEREESVIHFRDWKSGKVFEKTMGPELGEWLWKWDLGMQVPEIEIELEGL